MKKLLIIVFYIAHFFLMLAGIVFAVLYFAQGEDVLAEGLITKDAESYIYAYLSKSESTANIEDLWFCILFICFAVLVRFLSARQAVSNNT